MPRNKNQNQMDRVEFFYKYRWVTVTFLFMVIMLGQCTPARAIPNDPYVIKMVDSMKVEIEKNNIQHAKIVLRQSAWESGWFKCNNCSYRYNNPFGFRHKSWVTDSNPKGYLKFDTWQESVAYYKRWQDKFYKGGDYYTFLYNIGYAGKNNSKYITDLKSLSV